MVFLNGAFTWSSLPSCLKSDPLVTLELPPMKTDHELHQLDLCLKINRVPQGNPHGNPYGTQKSRSNLIFLIWIVFFMARLNKWWRVGLPCCRSKMRASSRRLRVPGLSRARPNHLITLKSNGLETWFPHVSHCFPIRMTIWCSNHWGYTRCSNIPRVGSHSSVQGSDFGQYTCIQCKSSLICFNMPC